MAQSVRIQRGVTIGSTFFGENRTQTVDAAQFNSQLVPTATTDLQIIFPIDFSQIQAIMMLSTYDVTVETNSGSSPTDTISLKAGVAKVWTVNDVGTSCFITADCTNIYITNTSGSSAVVTFAVCYDVTP